MIRFLVSVIIALALILLTGIQAFGPGLHFGIPPELVIFVATVFFGIMYVQTVLHAEKEHRATQAMALDLENANIKLTQLDKLKSEFLSFASHQIKAPMTVIKGYAQLILDGSYGVVSDAHRDIIDKIKASVDRMIGLVDTFLNLRRIDEGRIQYRMEPLEVTALVAPIVDELQQLASRKHLRLALEPPARVWRVNGDSQNLRQVIQNLIDNAVKYTETGSVTVSIVPGERPATVTIRVTDTGRGISRELAPKLFEQFSRDESVGREIAGTGLGLYIARRIIEAHSGRIWAMSPGPGRGSTFSVELPTL